MRNAKLALALTSTVLASGAAAQGLPPVEIRDAETEIALLDNERIVIGGLSGAGTGGRPATRTLPYRFSTGPVFGLTGEIAAVSDDGSEMIGHFLRGFAHLPIAGNDTVTLGIGGEIQTLGFGAIESITAHPTLSLDFTPAVSDDRFIALRIEVGQPVAVGRDYANGAAVGSVAGSQASVEAVRQFTAPILQTVFEEPGVGARADLRFGLSPDWTGSAAVSVIDFDSLGVLATDIALGISGGSFGAEVAFEAVDFSGFSEFGVRARIEAQVRDVVLGLSAGNTAVNSAAGGDAWTQADILFGLGDNIEIGLQALDLGRPSAMAYGVNTRVRLDDRFAVTIGAADLDSTTVVSVGVETLVLLRPSLADR